MGKSNYPTSLLLNTVANLMVQTTSLSIATAFP